MQSIFPRRTGALTSRLSRLRTGPREMGRATLNITVVPKRMLTRAEAADYCGRPAKRFQMECTVQPVRFPNGDLRWDLRDLDVWLDGLKEGHPEVDMESLLARLD
jgi:hypothetical protein